MAYSPDEGHVNPTRVVNGFANGCPGERRRDPYRLRGDQHRSHREAA